MDPTLISTVLLPAAVGVIMFGLGLGLTPADFARVMQRLRTLELLLVPGSHDDYGEIDRQFAAVRDFLDRAMRG